MNSFDRSNFCYFQGLGDLPILLERILRLHVKIIFCHFSVANMKLYLASKSPRRRELLEQMEVEFEILPIDTPEVVAPNEASDAYSKRITKEKLDAAWKTIIQDHLPPLPVLCADTEVVLDGVILGKPIDEHDAFQMIQRYAGKTHEVITSVGITFYDYQKIHLKN